VQSWQEIEAVMFSANSSHLILQRRPATAAGAGTPGRGGAGGPGSGAEAEAGGTPAGPQGVDVILLSLYTGRYQLLGIIGDISPGRCGYWQIFSSAHS
jgi:hypothetical protein